MDDIVDELRTRHLQTHPLDVSVYATAADEIVRLRDDLHAAMDDGEMWRRVAIALNSRLADEMSDPTCDATLAYNAARNGRFIEAVWHARREVEAR